MNEKDYKKDLWLWFGLSRASFLTLPRSVLHEMPDEWQGKFADLLNELDDTFCHAPILDLTVRNRQNGKLSPMPEWAQNYRHPDKKLLRSFQNARAN